MLNTDMHQWLSLVSNPAFLIIVFWFVREIYALSRTKINNVEAALKDNTLKITELNLSLARLEVELHGFRDSIQIIPKLKADLDFAHQKLRDLDQ